MVVQKDAEVIEKVIKQLEELTERYNDNKELKELLDLVQK